ncbi:hypothetical protein WISP_72895 [Willisornis vidua]|uniref:Uncharacterized protein n=1 Tax=Willisornis vidua TaxID=1566151 RepID=A0ABQ9D7M8_9PASS|nr:hypothetical protein WISP_72895 [Willisornis vidua]
MLMRTQLRWAGHVSRMEDHRLPEIVLYGELATDCCRRGAPKKRYKDCLKQHLSLGHIDHHQWISSWDSWRHTIHNAAASFENTHRVSLKEKRPLGEKVPRQYHQRRLLVVPFAIRLAYPTLASLASRMLAASVGRALPKSSFMKPGQDDEGVLEVCPSGFCIQ